MKKLLKMGIVFVAMLMLTFLPTRECESGDFGYYGGSSWGQNYLSELSGSSNIATLEESGYNIASAIVEAHNNGMQSIIMVWHVFFDIQNWDTPQMTITLYPDYQARWDNYAAQIEPYEPYVHMFYVLDEPYWNGQRAGISQTAMRETLELVTSTILSTFPSVEVGTCFAYVVVNNYLVLPTNFTLVGFDYYYYLPQSLNAYYNQYNQYLSIFLEKMSYSQALFLVPGGFQDIRNRTPQRTLNRIANFFLTVYLHNPKAEMMLVWLYPPMSPWIGLKYLPWTFNHYETIGEVVINH